MSQSDTNPPMNNLLENKPRSRGGHGAAKPQPKKFTTEKAEGSGRFLGPDASCVHSWSIVSRYAGRSQEIPDTILSKRTRICRLVVQRILRAISVFSLLLWFGFAPTQ